MSKPISLGKNKKILSVCYLLNLPGVIKISNRLTSWCVLLLNTPH